MIEGLKPYAEYKESGSQWIGSVPSSWTVRNLRTLISSRSERNRPDLPLLSVAREKGVFVRSLTDANENHNFIPDDLTNYKVAHTGDLVINKMKAWQGSMGIAPCDGIVSPAYFVFEFRIVNHAFGQALLRSKPYVAHFGQASDGVRIGQWDLSIPGMRQIPILVPNEDEQTAIVRFLDQANRKINRFIRTKRRLIELLNEKKQVIIHRAVTRGLDPDVRLKPSGIEWLGDVPEHWEVKRLKYIARIAGRIGFRGYTTDDLVASGEGALALGATHINTSGEIDLTSPVFISWRKYYESPEIMVHQDDILVVQRGSTSGKIGFVLKNPGAATINPSLILVSAISGIAEFVFLSLTCATTRSYLNSLLSSTAIPMLSQEQVRNTPVLLPPMAEQQQLLISLKSELRDVELTIVNTRREIDLIREYRTRLISDVVTGKLDVRSVELPTMDEAETIEDVDTGEETEAQELIESEEMADANE